MIFQSFAWPGKYQAVEHQGETNGEGNRPEPNNEQRRLGIRAAQSQAHR